MVCWFTSGSLPTVQVVECGFDIVLLNGWVRRVKGFNVVKRSKQPRDDKFPYMGNTSSFGVSRAEQKNRTRRGILELHLPGR